MVATSAPVQLQVWPDFAKSPWTMAGTGKDASAFRPFHPKPCSSLGWEWEGSLWCAGVGGRVLRTSTGTPTEEGHILGPQIICTSALLQ